MATKRGLVVGLAGAALMAALLWTPVPGVNAEGGAGKAPPEVVGQGGGNAGQEPPDVVGQGGGTVDETQQREPPQIDVVFVLDTTGSMSGLINAAKEKIWSIATTLAQTKPAPSIRMGLVAYRDRGDEYVTLRTDLSEDLDAVYTGLMGLRAQGGGDMPESVNGALHEAVSAMSWRKGQNVYRTLFLVGDSPPHMDYQDDVKYADSCRAAANCGIVVNAVQCGATRETTPAWEDIARLGGGKYFRVEQSGSAVLAATPFDGELARLARELDGTRVAYGSRDERAHQKAREERADRIYEAASPTSAATRAAFNGSASGERNFSSADDLVTDVGKGKVSLADVPDEKLPEELRRMSAPEREAYVKTQAERRAKVVERIEELSRARQKHLVEKLGAEGKKLDDTLEQKVYEAVKEQAAERDIEYRAPCASF